MSVPVVIAVVSWNTRELLRQCLRSLLPEHEAGRAQVWVVDNASSDGSAEMVAAEFGWAELVASKENLGFGRAVNLVAERTDSEWIAPANADVGLYPGALVELLEAGAAESGAAILAPRLIGPDGEIQQTVHAFPGLALAGALSFGLAALSPALARRLCLEGSWDPAEPREVDWAHGAFLLCRREAWEGIGGFDDRQWMYAEDLDLAWRARRAGWSVRYVPGARLAHEGKAATAQAFGDELGARYMQATFAWMTDRRGLWVTYAYAAINLSGAAVRWVAYGLAALVSPGRFAARRDAARGWLGLHRKALARRATLLSFR